jgi:hypothetical protein
LSTLLSLLDVGKQRELSFVSKLLLTNTETRRNVSNWRKLN